MDDPCALRKAGRLAVLAALPLLASACSDRGDSPTIVVPPGGSAPVLAALECRAVVAQRTVTCAPATGGARFDLHTLGGQGVYVRLAASSAAYASDVFSFDLTVQNLSDLAYATADGATRHDDGVRVFFHSGPTVTSGSGAITVDNEDGTGTFTAAGQPFFQYGGDLGGIDQPELGAEGILVSSETSTAKTWELGMPATVLEFSFILYISTQTPAGAIATVAPQVTAVAPDPMVPGSAATLTGINFDATPGDNAVTIGGVAATVTGGTGTTELTVTVPCVLSGDVNVQVTTGGMKGAAFEHPLETNLRTLAAGEAVVVTDPAEVACNEIASSGVDSEYVIAVYNTATSPISTTDFQVSADGTGDLVLPARLRRFAAPAPPRMASPLTLGAAVAAARQEEIDQRHYRLLERNRAAHQRLRRRFAGDPRMRRSVVSLDVVPPVVDTFFVADLNEPDFCDSPIEVPATRVYYDGKLAIYEDNANPITAAGNATLAGYYDDIGDQFNADMEPVVTTFFGDPLLRDDVTDDNGVVVALFTEVVNDSFPGVAGFVVSCDQYPNAAGNSASNFGEFFYALVPTSTTPGYASSSTMDSWYWSIRATFIHETKHVVHFAERVDAAAPDFEESWLEEGLARHSEELWAREAVYNVAWKDNTGYGSAGSPGSLYCDYRRTDAPCLATDPARPSLNLFRHFQGLNTFLSDPTDYSPFGATAAGGSSFYATSWSLVRYALDRYAATEEAFLTAITQTAATGVANLEAVAGVDIEELLGGWALALYADDYPGLVGADDVLLMPTWNFTDIYLGLNDDFPATFPTVYPLAPTLLAYGSFAPVSVPSIAGGAVAYFGFSGVQSAPQLLRLEDSGGGAPPATLRIAIGRVK
ncbi:MAG TPA: IPT/TIG domain-containing protein [Longimicrobiaceae bacterium]|nr:IPT/TIG domain-containing protein [Longimicrobiaceae bacterium]